jgi:serine/threonine protein kinase
MLSDKKGSSEIILIDFGLARLFRDPQSKFHMAPNLHHGFTGTTIYSSANCHLSLAPSRRDDLESWLYCLIEF